MISYSPEFEFARNLLGHFSNKNQAIEHPKEFAHINIYFRPFNNHNPQGFGIYSEQSYNHDPWNPYRQGIHKISRKGDVVIVENYEVDNLNRLAGAGRMPSLLKDLKPNSLIQRHGCAMHFKKINEDHYKGFVEPGKKCLIPRDGKLTYLVSEVELTDRIWISRDRGFLPDSNEQVWGSEHGQLIFEKIASYAEEITESSFK